MTSPHVSRQGRRAAPAPLPAAAGGPLDPATARVPAEAPVARKRRKITDLYSVEIKAMNRAIETVEQGSEYSTVYRFEYRTPEQARRVRRVLYDRMYYRRTEAFLRFYLFAGVMEFYAGRRVARGGPVSRLVKGSRP